jgi:hypothetical protein
MKSRIITFSRTFPSYHLRKGEPTFFVEAILTQLGIDYTSHNYFVWLVENNPKISEVFLDKFYNSLSQNIAPKSHTIRSHKRPLKVGEYINPNCWAGKPYNKTEEGFWQIKFAPNIEVKKMWGYEVKCPSKGVEQWFLNSSTMVSENNEYMQQWFNANLIKEIAKNDGLELADFLLWFKHPSEFKGNIICWNENIEY